MSGTQAFRIPEAIREALRLHRQGKPEEAAQLYEAVLKVRPQHFDALHLLGILRTQQGKLEVAVELIARALERQPQSAEAHSNLGIALARLGCHEAALASYDRALALKPQHVDTLINRGNALQALNRSDEAMASYDRALAVRPDHVGALINRATVFQGLKRYDEAIASYDRALAIDPGYAHTLFNRGNALQSLNHHDEAIASYDRALTIDPEFRYTLGAAAYSRAYVCDWQDHGRRGRRLADAVRSGKPVIDPFAYLAFSESPPDQRICADVYVRDKYPPLSAPLWSGERYGHGRVRVAYLSADFHEHATGYLMAELFERHDRSRFEIIGVSFGPDQHSAMRTRLIAAFERFIDVRAKSDEEVARRLREAEVDIAVDLKGFTRDCRPGILAHRPAPIQVNYLGYPGTMGAEYIDYILADEFVIPREQQVHYSEKVVCLPDSYQVNDTRRRIAERTPTRAEAGLPERGFVFCCFNNSYKLTPTFFDIWMRLLQRVERSVLWLLQGGGATERNLRREAQARGVDAGRLVFAPRLKLEEHLARHRLADLFLDTLPYNAHTTASDALWAGLPVVTCAGTTFAGRVAGSLLRAVGLPELVTHTLADYEALALRLATDGERFAKVKAKLARNRLTAPLFDTERFRRHIEAAYTAMWEIHRRGEAPRPFTVGPAAVAPKRS